MKKALFILSLVTLLVFTTATAYAQTTNEIIVAIDSAKVEFTEDSGSPFVDENNRTLVPFRKALETYGATVEWNNEDRVAIAIKGDVKVEVPLDKNYIIINGEQKTIDTTAKIVNERTFLPIRAVIEAFDSSVEWDQNLNTVVITTTPVDAKTIFLNANNKSYEWKSYDADIKMNMSMPIKDDAGNIYPMNMDINMYMTIFMNPTLKAKINASLEMDAMGQEITQPIMDMYFSTTNKAFITYMGINDGSGNLSWLKSTAEDELLVDMLKYNKETTKQNQELVEKYTKEVKYFGKYTENGKTLTRLQYTMSGEIYNDMFSEYLNTMSTSTNEQDIMTVEMFKAFAEGNFGNLTYIVYIDDATGEMVKYEMDLGNIIVSLLDGMSGMTGEIPAEEMEVLKQMKATIVMEILNINKAKDFKIPAEALNAPEMPQELVQPITQ